MNLRVALTLVALTALGGCDDLVGFDVGTDGRVLAAIDGDGRAAFIADGAKPRDLFWIDPATGKRDRLTREARPLAGVRALGAGAVAVEGRRRLVAIATDGTTRTLLEVPEESRLFAPAVSADASRVAVVEARRLGETGTLHVIEVATAARELALEGALPGAQWASGQLVVARRRSGGLGGDEAPAEGRVPVMEGELVALAGGRATALAHGTLAPFVPIVPGSRLLTVVPSASRDALELAVVDSGTRTLRPVAPGEGSVAFAASSPGGRVAFTRSAKGEPSLEGDLYVTASSSDLAAAKKIETSGAVSAPRWVSEDRIVYVLGDAIVAQDRDGKNRLVLAGPGRD